MNKAFFVALAAVGIFAAGCTSTPQIQTGPDAEMSHDGLTKVDKTIMDVVWVRPEADLSHYNKIIFEGVGVEYRPVTGPYSGRPGTGSSSRSEYRLDDATKARFEEAISTAFLAELGKSKKYEIVDQPGPDVLRVWGGLLDVVSKVPPTPMGRGEIFIDSVGEATLVLELRDSESHAILARAIDRRAAQSSSGMINSNRVTNMSEVRRLGGTWGSLLRNGLEKLLSGDQQ